MAYADLMNANLDKLSLNTPRAGQSDQYISFQTKLRFKQTIFLTGLHTDSLPGTSQSFTIQTKEM